VGTRTSRGLADLWNGKTLSDLFVATKWRVCFQQKAILFRPLEKYRQVMVRNGPNKTDLEELRLWVPETKLNLVDSRLMLQGIGRQILYPLKRRGGKDATEKEPCQQTFGR